jgi:hypothetical protein
LWAVQLLVNVGVGVDVRNAAGQTALHMAAQALDVAKVCLSLLVRVTRLSPP